MVGEIIERFKQGDEIIQYFTWKNHSGCSVVSELKKIKAGDWKATKETNAVI